MKNKGQTLLEIIMATAILSVALVAILGLVLQSLLLSSESKQRTQAAFLIQDVFERAIVVRNLNIKTGSNWSEYIYSSNGWYDYGTCCTGRPYTFAKISDTETRDDYGFNMHELDGITFKRYINITGSGDEVKITVTVRWPSNKYEQKLTMSMSLTRWAQQ